VGSADATAAVTSAGKPPVYIPSSTDAAPLVLLVLPAPRGVAAAAAAAGAAGMMGAGLSVGLFCLWVGDR
jgi:hypothetical protein